MIVVTRVRVIHRASALLACIAVAIAGLAVAPGANAASAVDPTRLIQPSDLPTILGAPRSGATTNVVEEPAMYGLQLCNDSGSSWDVQIPGPATFTVATFGIGDSQRSGAGQFVYRFRTADQARRTINEIRSRARACQGSRTSTTDGGTVTTTLTNGVISTDAVWVNHLNEYGGADKGWEPIDRFAVFTAAGDAILVTSVWRIGATRKLAGFSTPERLAVYDLAQVLGRRWAASMP